jgi:hypothetical protein
VDRNSESAPSQLWSRLEAFAHRVHGSLDPTEVAYIVANEGRCLVGCDRLSVAIVASRGLRIEAVSGVDVVDRHSNLVRQMGRLCDRVRAWGELLVYTGCKDEALPADVFAALDAYLAQSPSKVLVVLPLIDGRAGSRDQQSVLLMESFEPSQSSEELIARLQVVGRHAARALYNAHEYARIPFRRLWVFLIKARIVACLAGVLVAALLAVLSWAPSALKLDAEGHLLPAERRWLYSPLEAQVVDFADAARPGATVSAGQALVLMYDAQLEVKLVELEQDIAGAQAAVEALSRAELAAITDSERLRFSSEKQQREFARERKAQERKALLERIHADEARPGHFWLPAPIAGTVLNADFHENLVHRTVKPSEPLLRLGNRAGPWDLELRIPQRHVARVLAALDASPLDQGLTVEFVVQTSPSTVFRATLTRDRIACEAEEDRTSSRSLEPTVTAFARVEDPGADGGGRPATGLLVAGADVRARIRCGDRSLGYVLFHDAWEFVKEKAAFLF